MHNKLADADIRLETLESSARRNFLTQAAATATGLGFALAVQPVMAQTAIVTSPEGLDSGMLTTRGAAGEVQGYYARPAQGGNFPMVLVVSEIFGVHEYIADVCRRLAKQGYLAVAPELFARYGDPRKLNSIPEIMSAVIAKVPDAEVMADLDAVAQWGASHGGDNSRLAITGFCWGGRIVWLYAAHNPRLKAGVAWYGRLRSPVTPQTPRHPLDLVKELKAPVLGLYGGLDQGIPLSDVDEMNAALAAIGSKSHIHVYDNAPHAFHADYRPSYRKQEAEDGWQRLLAWFKQNGL